MAKKKEETKKLEVKIKVKYNIGSKAHEEVFNRYALFGKWFVANWWKIRIVNINTEGIY